MVRGPAGDLSWGGDERWLLVQGWLVLNFAPLNRFLQHHPPFNLPVSQLHTRNNEASSGKLQVICRQGPRPRKRILEVSKDCVHWSVCDSGNYTEVITSHHCRRLELSQIWCLLHPRQILRRYLSAEVERTPATQWTNGAAIHLVTPRSIFVLDGCSHLVSGTSWLS